MTKLTSRVYLLFLCLLLRLQCVSAQSGKGAATFGGPPLGTWFLGTEMEEEAIGKWQSYLADADATGTFTLPGFNLSQPWSDADPLDWTVKIAVKADMKSPLGSPDGDFVTGGSVWLEPPDGLVTAGSNYTANPEWYPFMVYYSSRGLYGSAGDAPLTPFFHRNPDEAERRADGTCDGILPPRCIEALVNAEATGGDVFFRNTGDLEFAGNDFCPGIGGPWPGSFGSPLNLTERRASSSPRNEEDAADASKVAMPFNEGWVLSFSSMPGPEGNVTDYARHGSQYVPVLFHWMRDGDFGTFKPGEPKPKGGNVVHLMCLAVNEPAEGRLLPDPGEEYLKAVQPAEDEPRSSAGRLTPALSIVLGLLGIMSVGLSNFGY